MKNHGWGRIINISSVAGRVGRKNLIVYGAAKAAVLGITRALALELGPHGITVNAICPGPIDTIRLRTIRAVTDGEPTAQTAHEYEEAVAAMGRRLPVGRLGRPEDIGATATFLAGEGASFITGFTINVDGGETSSD
jgi:NAD(P)-dependent dehydrogenase (short-subunit alcohol dehydrogenase family)